MSDSRDAGGYLLKYTKDEIRRFMALSERFGCTLEQAIELATVRAMQVCEDLPRTVAQVIPFKGTQK